ncbi:GH16269 [Drosophila grimshawi]|uniref:GH16269 n=1 Tax=Drosophila grimshawi TaxID=7222 RepID=B4IXW3_DROGR|nr:GH16269 [Drosophila grimshawi]
MNQVWLLFKVLQVVLDLICISIHITGSLHFAEPLPHNLIFCGTFSSFFLLSVIRCIRLIGGQRTVLHPELIIAVCSMLLHFICAWVSMQYAEGDFHLQFMGPREELDHAYFGYCKKQSLACIVTGAVYLLQAILVLDLIVKSPPNEDLRPMWRVSDPPIRDAKLNIMNNEERDKLARTTADVYFLGKKVDHWLRLKSQWFRQLAGGQPQMSMERARLERPTSIVILGSPTRTTGDNNNNSNKQKDDEAEDEDEDEDEDTGWGEDKRGSLVAAVSA